MLDAVFAATADIPDLDLEVLVVDDGSTDATVARVQTRCDTEPRLGLLCLHRRFGKEAAIHAGLSHARGDGVVVMDGDLQHPPGLIPAMVAHWRRGVPVVEAVKRQRGPEAFWWSWLARGFYRLFQGLSGLDIAHQSDFKLLDRQVVDAYLALPERQRFFRGLVAWMGFPALRLPFEVAPRASGRSGFTALRLLAFSSHALTAFSPLPLYLMLLMSGLTLLLALIIGGIAIYHKLLGVAVSGFTTVILLMLIIGSFTMLGLGLIGLYLAQLFDEVKRRPLWLVDRRRSRWRESPVAIADLPADREEPKRGPGSGAASG